MRKALLILALCALAASTNAQPRFDLEATPTAFGLFPVVDADMDRVYARPDAGLEFYKSVFVAPVSIAFRPDRAPSGRRLDPYKLQEMSLYFQRALREALAGTSYAVVDQPTLGTLKVEASIIGLRLGAGVDTDESSPAYFDSVAEMTLVLELSDGLSGQLLVQVADDGKAVRSLADDASVSDRDTVIRLLEGWAGHVAARMDQIHRLGGSLNSNR
ncbi:MAG: DUF3313 family protein [Pseudomonadota bacterium]